MVDIDKYIASFTSDRRTREILRNAATVDDSPDSRRVLKSFLGPQLTSLVYQRAPEIFSAAQSFVCAPEPNNIYRGIQLYVWLNEKIPEDQDRATLILLGMMTYIEQEKKADSAREIVDHMTTII